MFSDVVNFCLHVDEKNGITSWGNANGYTTCRCEVGNNYVVICPNRDAHSPGVCLNVELDANSLGSIDENVPLSFDGSRPSVVAFGSSRS